MADAIGKLQGDYDLGPLPRFQPEPATSVGFEAVANALLNAGKSALGNSIDPLGFRGSLNGLIDQQIEVQKLMLETSLRSNLEKARHDMEMAPVRNIRVS